VFDVQDLNMEYDGNSSTIPTGNLTKRIDKTKGVSPWQSETFTYEDNRGRLKTISINGATAQTMQYDDAKNGNIKIKPDASTQDYMYDATKLHAVKNINFACSTAAPINYKEDQIITYTPFNKAATLSQTDIVGVGTPTPVANLVTYTYGTDEERTISEYKKDGVVQTKRYYHGSYEKLETYTAGVLTNTKHIYYISGANGLCAIATKDNAVSTLTYNYVFTDHLGSILKLTNNAGAAVAEQSFDAWGRLRNPNNWSDYAYVQPNNSPLGAGNAPTGGFLAGAGWLTRGYTGHEHVPQVDLINMNGRLYDAVVGRMLSADKYVADASNSQSYNRYSYCSNNPLKYTDPSGWRQQSAPYEEVARESGDGRGGGGGGGAAYLGNWNNITSGSPLMNNFGSTMLSAMFLAPSQQYYINSVTGNYMYGSQVIGRNQYLAGSYITKNMLGSVSYYKKTGEYGYWNNFNSSVGGRNGKGDEILDVGEVISESTWVPYASSESADFGLTVASTMTDLFANWVLNSDGGSRIDGKGNRFRGGSQKDRDQDMSKYPPDFKNWYHLPQNIKDYKLPGQPDPDLDEPYQDWLDLGRPKSIVDWNSISNTISIATGLTGTSLTIYLILSEGSRVIPVRNLIPIP